MRTLLSICQELTQRIGLPRPKTIIGAGGELAPQYVGMIYEAARDMIRAHDWQVLTIDASFQTVEGDVQVGSMREVWPDIKRIDHDTVLNITRGRKLMHLLAAEHAAMKLNPSPGNDGIFYRIVGDKMVFPGNTTADDEVVFEYTSRRFITAAGSDERIDFFQDDGDIILLDDEAIILGVRWRFLKANGFEYGEEQNDFKLYMQDLIGADTPKRDINLSGRGNGGLISSRTSIVISG